MQNESTPKFISLVLYWFAKRVRRAFLIFTTKLIEYEAACFIFFDSINDAGAGNNGRCTMFNLYKNSISTR